MNQPDLEKQLKEISDRLTALERRADSVVEQITTIIRRREEDAAMDAAIARVRSPENAR